MVLLVKGGLKCGSEGIRPSIDNWYCALFWWVISATESRVTPYPDLDVTPFVCTNVTASAFILPAGFAGMCTRYVGGILAPKGFILHWCEFSCSSLWRDWKQVELLLHGLWSLETKNIQHPSVCTFFYGTQGIIYQFICLHVYLPPLECEFCESRGAVLLFLCFPRTVQNVWKYIFD